MTRGRHANTAHLVAEDVEDARRQWIEVFSRDRSDLGPAHARQLAIDAIDRYGPAAGAAPTPRVPPRSTGRPPHGPPESASDERGRPTTWGTPLTCRNAKFPLAFPVLVTAFR
jgi:hypothetical protein